MESKNKNIVFRVDASIEMGSGHVMRCLTLADALVINGAKCYFICREHSGHMLEMIESRGHVVSLLPASDLNWNSFSAKNQLEHACWLGDSMERDAAQTISVIKSLNLECTPEWAIVDHYAIDITWENSLKSHYKKLMVIDDLADRKHSCDVLLDQTYGRNETDYTSYVPEKCKLLIGSNFALLRPEFSALREYNLKKRAIPSFKSILITMGGIDKNNVTSNILYALKDCSLPKGFRITVIMGGKAPWLKEVKKLSSLLPMNIDVKVDVVDMAHQMTDSDLCIGAVGSTTWERCCLGLPSILMVLAENQKMAAIKLKEQNIVNILMSVTGLNDLINLYANDSQLLTRLVTTSSNICDGLGVLKVMNYLNLENMNSETHK